MRLAHLSGTNLLFENVCERIYKMAQSYEGESIKSGIYVRAGLARGKTTALNINLSCR